MTPEHIFTAITIMLTTVNAGLTLLNIKFNRRKDFQDKLFQLKLDSYNEMNFACYEAVISLSVNNSPFNEIYKIDDKKDWEKYFTEKINPEYHKYFEIQKLTYKYSLILPVKAVDKYHEFTNNCISFILIVIILTRN